jgi:adenosine deaminase
MCDRTFDRALNETIVAKALRWADRGVVGIDIAGPRPGVGAAGPDQLSPGPRSERQRAPQAGPDQLSPGPRSDRFPYADLADAFAAARAAGLGVTVHAGEEGEPDELGEVVETLRPDRVGHGVLAAHRPDLCRQLIAAGVVLEVCPTSNLRTGVFGSVDELVDAVRSLHAAGVPLTVSTDGPTMQRTNLRDEHALLVSAGAWRAEDAHVANQRAFDASFCRPAR